MSILDQRKLIESIHPFASMQKEALDSLMPKIDIAYYPKDTLLISPTLTSIAFYIIIKGMVSEYLDEELLNIYGASDSFDANALIYSTTQSRFVVSEELICYEIAKEDFLELLQDKAFQSYFLQDFVSRHQQLKAYATQSELTPFVMARISDIFLHPVCIVPHGVSIRQALERMESMGASVILTQEAQHYGIITDTNLRRHLLLGAHSVDESVQTIHTPALITLESHDFLFNALLTMTHHNIKRIVITQEAQIIGVLEQIDLLSYFANHSHLVAVQINQAHTIEDVVALQGDLHHLIVALQAKGVKVRYISKMVTTLNAKLYAKLFEIVVPAPLRAHCALIVMGSEGRGEQITKTDQDNALIIEEGLDVAPYLEAMGNFTQAMQSVGFPLCSGGVMASNPAWCMTLGEYKSHIHTWVSSMREEDLQRLSILADAHHVAGSAVLVQELRMHLAHTFEARDDVLAHMAKAVLYFDTPLSTLWGLVASKESDHRLDIKKGGIFALVHGMRTLALQYHIDATNTIERVKALNNMGVFDKMFASELIEAFDTLSTFGLRSKHIDVRALSKIERDLLKDALKVVNTFKAFMRYHFHLNMVG